MRLTLTVDLTPQRSKRGQLVQQADADTIGGTLHYVQARHRNSGGAKHLAESRRRLEQAAKGYEAAEVSVEWFRVKRWEYEVAQAEEQCARGTFPYRWMWADDNEEVSE